MQHPNLAHLLHQFTSLIFSITGLISASIFMLIHRLSGYTRSFDTGSIAACSTSNQAANWVRYLRNLALLDLLVTVLDAVAMGVFLGGFFGVVWGVWGNWAAGRATGLRFGVKVCVSYLGVLATLALFGNCVKTYVAIGIVSGCTTSAFSLQQFRKTTLVLIILSAFSLLSSILYIITTKILYRPQAIYHPDPDPEPHPQIEHINSHTNLIEPQKNHPHPQKLTINEQIKITVSTPRKEGLLSAGDSSGRSEDPVVERSPGGRVIAKPRLFNRKFLGESVVNSYLKEKISENQSANSKHNSPNAGSSNPYNSSQKLIIKKVDTQNNIIKNQIKQSNPNKYFLSVSKQKEQRYKKQSIVSSQSNDQPMRFKSFKGSQNSHQLQIYSFNNQNNSKEYSILKRS